MSGADEGLLARLLAGRPLVGATAEEWVARLTDPALSDAERAALLVARPPARLSAAELAAIARALRRRSAPFPVLPRQRPVDLCGTGGAPRPAFNVGTVSALVVRAAGAPVLKHGNRSARGARGGWAGSSDLVEALGLARFLDDPAFARRAFRAEGIAFLHAPVFHPAMRAVAPVRRLLGVPTAFNLIGPLTNPAAPSHAIVGAPDGPTARRLADAASRLGVQRGLAVFSRDGTGEISSKAETVAYPIGRASARPWRIDPRRWLPPEDRRGPLDALPPPDAAREAERILAGGGGARRGSVVLTSAAALWVRGDAPSYAAAIDRAAAALDRGAAAALLGRLRTLAGGPSEAGPREVAGR
ncbi:MAG: anthranilate phosphoribosyltransferase [Thermoplasmata archaeon]